MVRALFAGICVCLLMAQTIPAAETAPIIGLAINDLRGQGVSQSEAAIISDRLRNELVNSNLFSIMERGEMETILKEQGFQQSGACDDNSCLVQIGQLLGVQQLVAGSVGKIGNLYTISIRVVDVKTGRIAMSLNVDYKGSIDEVLTKATPQIAQQLIEKTQSKDKKTASSTGKKETTVKPGDNNWMYWTAAGVVVVGGGAAAYLLLNKKPVETAANPTGTVRVEWNAQ